ncbi:MAG: alkyl hydroperoxide reductase, partial [Caulobacter sp.]|nr:alkyl hydroperoxide reductase [Caulobacter sp.]
MSLDALREALPAYAKDLSLNLSSLAGETLLTDQQKWGAFVASAHAVGVPAVVRDIEAAARAAGLTEEALAAAKAASAIMGMNNVYYRSLHLMKNKEYATLPARLRMNLLASPGVEKVDFELWSTAVSAVNGC